MRATGDLLLITSARARRISVVIPARNEAASIGPVIDRALEAAPLEVIVVDGQSTDGTAAVAEAHGARVVASPPGRGRQLNCGAAAAAGDVLLLLHADTFLPRRFGAHIGRILAGRGVCAGAFRLRIDAPGGAFRMIERAVNWRSRLLQMPYGDQGIFLDAATFRRVGGCPDIPAMEDFELVRRLRRLGRIEIAEAAVVTSARRWARHGIRRTTMLNQACIAAYLLGVSAHRIAGWRETVEAEAASGEKSPAGARHSSAGRSSRDSRGPARMERPMDRGRKRRGAMETQQEL